MENNQLVYIVEDDTSIRELEMYALKNANSSLVGFEERTSFLKELD